VGRIVVEHQLLSIFAIHTENPQTNTAQRNIRKIPSREGCHDVTGCVMNHKKIYHNNPKLKERARLLRINNTLSEVLFWNELKTENMPGVLCVINAPLTPFKRGIGPKVFIIYYNYSTFLFDTKPEILVSFFVGIYYNPSLFEQFVF